MQQKSRVEISALLVGNTIIGFDIPYRVISSDHQLKNLIKVTKNIIVRIVGADGSTSRNSG